MILLKSIKSEKNKKKLMLERGLIRMGDKTDYNTLYTGRKILKKKFN